VHCVPSFLDRVALLLTNSHRGESKRQRERERQDRDRYTEQLSGLSDKSPGHSGPNARCNIISESGRGGDADTADSWRWYGSLEFIDTGGYGTY